MRRNVRRQRVAVAGGVGVDHGQRYVGIGRARHVGRDHRIALGVGLHLGDLHRVQTGVQHVGGKQPAVHAYVDAVFAAHERGIAQHRGAEHDAGEDFAQHGGLAEAAGNFAEEAGGAEQHAEGEEENRDLAGGEGAGGKEGWEGQGGGAPGFGGRKFSMTAAALTVRVTRAQRERQPGSKAGRRRARRGVA